MCFSFRCMPQQTYTLITFPQLITHILISHFCSIFQQRKPTTKLIPIWRFYWQNSVNAYSWHRGIHSHCQISRQRHVPKRIGSTWHWPFGRHTRLVTFYVNLKRSKRKNGHYVFKNHKKIAK